MATSGRRRTRDSCSAYRRGRVETIGNRMVLALNVPPDATFQARPAIADLACRKKAFLKQVEYPSNRPPREFGNSFSAIE
jgi:hypothetical protein